MRYAAVAILLLTGCGGIDPEADVLFAPEGSAEMCPGGVMAREVNGELTCIPAAPDGGPVCSSDAGGPNGCLACGEGPCDDGAQCCSGVCTASGTCG